MPIVLMAEGGEVEPPWWDPSLPGRLRAEEETAERERSATAGGALP
jgi:hypothetical protein